jgi:formamidopyrimidine-DNA glycosylase
MPEIPDLEVFSGNLTKKLAGKRIKKVTVLNTKKLNVSTNKLKKALENNVLKQIYRSGKELHFAFKDETILGLHLMLHGKLEWFEGKNKHKYTILELLFEDATGLAVTDFQKQATPTLNPEPDTAPDALSNKVNAGFLKKQLQQVKTTIKNFLLDQNRIRGIGNAYADEILYHARISPFSVSNKIPESKVKALARSIKTVLRNAQKQIRKIDPDIIGGELREFLAVHNSRKKQSPGGAAIQHKMVSSRKTYYTKEQQLYV